MKRRTLLMGGTVLAVAAAGGAWKLRLFRKRYPPTPYDDVLAHLMDREWAEKFGAQALKTMPDFAAATVAARLRTALASGSLASVALHEAEAGQVIEAGGWLVPQSVALIAALAAKAG